MNINWETVIVTALVAGPAWLASGAAFFKSRRTLVVAEDTHKVAEDTHKLVNSRMDELLRISKASAASDAILGEKDAEHARQGEAALATAAATAAAAAPSAKA